MTAGCVQARQPAEPGDPTPPPEVAAAATTTVEPGGGGVSANKLCTIFTDGEVAEVVGQVIDSGKNTPEMCRIIGADYVLDITAGPAGRSTWSPASRTRPLPARQLSREVP